MRRSPIAAFALVGLVAASILVGSARATETLSDRALRRSIVQVRISSSQYEYTRPWVRQAGRTYSVLGLVVPGNRILVRASDVDRATLLEVTKYSSYEPVLARVDIMDTEVNLALLQLESEDGFFTDLLPIPAGADPELGETVTAYKVDQLFRGYRERVDVTEVDSVADYGFTFLPVMVFRTRESFPGGGILLSGDRICGFISYASRDNRVEAIPALGFDTFRRRALEQPYSGFVSQGLKLSELVDPVLREYYRMPSGQHGAFVERVLPGTSAYGLLEAGDILMAVDGVPVDDRGFYEDPAWGRQHANLLFARRGTELRRPGDRLSVTVLRAGERRDVQLNLRAYAGTAERIPWDVDGQPPYLIENGMVFLELSATLLLQAYGQDWRSKAPELAYLFDTRRYYETPGADRIVILAGVLPGDHTRGYEQVGVMPVTQIAGRPVVNLEEMRRVLHAEAAAGHATLAIRLSDGRSLHVDLANRDQVNREFLEQYGIPALSQWD